MRMGKHCHRPEQVGPGDAEHRFADHGKRSASLRGGECRGSMRRRCLGVRWRGLDGRVVGMLCQRTMAGFAIHLRVHAAPLHFLDVGVAGLASLMAGVVDRMGGNLRDGSSAVVSILPKASRNKKALIPRNVNVPIA